MATITESLNFVLKGDPSNAVSAFKKVESASEKSLGDTEKRLDKIGTGLSKFGTVALATGAAVATGLFKLATGFERGALEADKFSKSTGLSVEQSSRLIEVAGDLGISTSTLETALGRMNKTLGTNAGAFKELGVQVAYARDGTVDVQQTFLNAVDALNRITDPTQRAAAAAKIFGKGWTDMARLIGLGADDIKKAMADVNAGQVFTDKDVLAAQKFHDSLDKLGDSAKAFGQDLARGVLPVLTTFFTIAGQVVDVFGKLPAPVREAVGQFAALTAGGLILAGTLAKVASFVLGLVGNFTSMTGSLSAHAASLLGATAAEERFAAAKLASIGAMHAHIAAAAADGTAARVAAGELVALTGASKASAQAMIAANAEVDASSAAMLKAQQRTLLMSTAMKTLGIAALAYVGLNMANSFLEDALAAGRLEKAMTDLSKATGDYAKEALAFQSEAGTQRDLWGATKDVVQDFAHELGNLVGVSKESGAEFTARHDDQRAFNKAIEQGLPFLRKYIDGLHAAGVDTSKMEAKYQDLISAQAGLNQGQSEVNKTLEDYATVSEAGQDASRMNADEAAKAADKIRDEAAAVEEHTAALKDNVAALHEEISALLEQAAKGGDVAAANIALSDAQIASTEATMATTAAIQAYNAEPTAENLIAVRDAILSERDAMINTAEAAGDLAAAQSTATSEAGKAVDRLDAINSSLIAQAKTATPQAQAAIGNYLADLNQIPPEKRTDFINLLAAGDNAAIREFILKNSGSFESLFQAQSDAAAAQAAQSELDAIANPREAVITTTAETAPANEAADAFERRVAGSTATVKVGADTAAADEAATSFQSRAASKAVKIPVTADSTPANQAADAFEARVAGTTAVAKVDANTAPADTKVQGFVGKKRDTTVDVKANTAPAESSTRGFTGQSRSTTVTVHANTGPAQSAISALNGRSVTVSVQGRWVGFVGGGGPPPGASVGAPRSVAPAAGPTAMAAAAPRSVTPTTNVTIMLPPGSDSDSRVVGSVQRWAKRNGKTLFR